MDVENLVRTIRGQEPKLKEANPETVEVVHKNGENKIVFSRDDILKAVAVKSDEGEIMGFDTDHDGNINFKLPPGVMPVLTRGRRLKGFDLTGNGEVDFVIPEKIQAIDSDGDGTLDGLSLSDDEEIDIDLNQILPIA